MSKRCKWNSKRQNPDQTAPIGEEPLHGVQRRMVLVDIFFEFFKLLFFALLLIYVT